MLKWNDFHLLCLPCTATQTEHALSCLWALASPQGDRPSVKTWLRCLLALKAFPDPCPCPRRCGGASCSDLFVHLSLL